MAPFRELKGQSRGHFVTQKKANRPKIILTYQFGANLKSVSCGRTFDISRARDVTRFTYVTPGQKKVVAKYLRRKYLFKSSFHLIYTQTPIFSRLHNVP